MGVIITLWKVDSTRMGLWMVAPVSEPRRPGRMARRSSTRGRTAIVIAAARQAPDRRPAHPGRGAGSRGEEAVQDRTRRARQGRHGGCATSTSPPTRLADQKLHAELRLCGGGDGVGLRGPAAHPKKRRRRVGRTVLAVGMIGAGAYAGYRVVRETRQNGAEPMPRRRRPRARRDARRIVPGLRPPAGAGRLNRSHPRPRPGSGRAPDRRVGRGTPAGGGGVGHPRPRRLPRQGIGR